MRHIQHQRDMLHVAASAQNSELLPDYSEDLTEEEKEIEREKKQEQERRKIQESVKQRMNKTDTSDLRNRKLRSERLKREKKESSSDGD